MDDAVTFTQFASALTDAPGTVLALPKAEWVTRLTTHIVVGDRSVLAPGNEALCRQLKTSGPALILGRTRDGARTNDAVETREALSLDIEKRSNAEVDAMIAALAPFEYVLHTTYRSTPEEPRFRVILFLDTPITGPDLPEKHRRAILALEALVGPVNDPSTRNAARLNFLPSTYDPKAAYAEHHLGRPLTMADLEPFMPTTTAAAPLRRRPKTGSRFGDAVAAYNADHPLDLPDSGSGDCPACGHRGCFGRMLEDPSRWSCFSSNHADETGKGAGVKSDTVWHGDALDLEAWVLDKSPEDALVERGYLAPPHEYRKGDLDRDITAAVEALARRTDLFKRGGQLVTVAHVADDGPESGVRRPIGGAIVLPVAMPVLGGMLSESLRGTRYDGRAQRTVACDPPQGVIAAVHAHGRWPGMRALDGVSQVPVLRPDGSVHDREGYDPQTRVYYAPTEPLPAVPLAPTQEDAKAALGALCEVVEDFPFASSADLSAWVAALLTALSRGAFDGDAPFFAVGAHTPGTGKTRLVDVISYVLTGLSMPRSPHTSVEEEMRKRVTAHAMAGDQLILIDNVPSNEALESRTLDAVATCRGIWRDRILGKTENVEIPMRATLFATGNNLMVGGDLGRRTIMVWLDTKLENPYERTDFAHADLLAWVRRERGRLLVAALTILRAYIVAGSPDVGLAPLGSFEEWHRLVRCACVWAGADDPVACLMDAEKTSIDPAEAAHVRLIVAMRAFDESGRGVTAAEMLDAFQRRKAEAKVRELEGAVMDACEAKAGWLPTSADIGYRLRSLSGRWRRVGTEKMRITQAKLVTKVVRWRVEVES